MTQMSMTLAAIDCNARTVAATVETERTSVLLAVDSPPNFRRPAQYPFQSPGVAISRR
jgi:hypothetical protein